MTEEQREVLTLYLGECLHENASNTYHPWKCSCGEEARDSVYLENHIEESNRTFDTDADMMALFRKTVDNGKWFSCENSFWDYAFFVWRADRDNDQRDYSAWLFYDPARFCCLVAQWLEERK